MTRSYTVYHASKESPLFLRFERIAKGAAPAIEARQAVRLSLMTNIEKLLEDGHVIRGSTKVDWPHENRPVPADGDPMEPFTGDARMANRLDHALGGYTMRRLLGQHFGDDMAQWHDVYTHAASLARHVGEVEIAGSIGRQAAMLAQAYRLNDRMQDPELKNPALKWQMATAIDPLPEGEWHQMPYDGRKVAERRALTKQMGAFRSLLTPKKPSAEPKPPEIHISIINFR